MKRARKGGYEQEAFSRWGKRYLNWEAGARKGAKVRANRRDRRAERQVRKDDA